MSKGLEAIAKATAGDKQPSKKTYLKKGQSIRVRIPEDIVENIHVFQTVSVFGKILTTLSYHGEKRTDKVDYYHEAHKLMVADHNARKEASDEPLPKEAWTAANVLNPKALVLFGVIPLNDFTQGKKNTLYPKGEPILLETNLGKDNANVDALIAALTKPANVKKFKSRAFEIECVKSNNYTFTALDEEDLTADELEVFKATEGVSVADEDFDNAIFESTPERQLEDLKLIGFDISRIEGAQEAFDKANDNGSEGTTIDVSADDLPF